MTSKIISVICGGDRLQLPFEPPVMAIFNHRNLLTPCEAYQFALENSDSELLIYVHDDVTVHDPKWLARVLHLMTFDDTVAVGLGGATSLGHPDLYKRSYRLSDMARDGYASNQTDWYVHGDKWELTRRVAVLDAFFMAVRRDFLVSIGGWPTDHLTHHCLDLWLACEAARAGKQTWMVGAECTHHGGGTSTKAAYRDAKWLQGGSVDSDHQEPHKWLYEEYRDVLPLKV